CSRVHAMQVDRFGQGNKSFRIKTVGEAAADSTKPSFLGEAKAAMLEHRHSGAALGELALAAVGRHRQTPCEVEPAARIAGRGTEAHDLALQVAQRGTQRMRA